MSNVSYRIAFGFARDPQEFIILFRGKMYVANDTDDQIYDRARYDPCHFGPWLEGTVTDGGVSDIELVETIAEPFRVQREEE